MFFSTQKNHGMYSILTKSILLHYKKKFKINSDINYFTKKKFSITFFLFFIYYGLILLIFRNKEKFLYLKYKNCEIGRHVTSTVFRDAASYKSKFNLFKNYLKYFYMGGLVIESAYYYSNRTKAIYIDHSGYLNGLFFSVFAKKKKIIYTNCYPRGLFFIDFSKKKNFKKKELEVCLRLEKKKITKNVKKDYVKRLIYRPSLIPHIRDQKWHKLKIKNLKKVDYVVYTHSFVDGLMWWGLDGFVNLRDWTEFTIETLINKKANILVKIHPNFFQKIKHDFIERDKKIFYEIMKKYSYYQNITFIDFPMKNKDILDGIRKDTVIVSHHGTALLEGVARRFKCISSIATLWSKDFEITNSWNSIPSYKKLLNKKWKYLKFADQKSFNSLEHQLFSNQYSLYGKNWWQTNLAKIFGIHLHTLIADPHRIANNISKVKFYKSIKKISKCIEEVNL
jgi:hypothetical protein